MMQPPTSKKNMIYNYMPIIPIINIVYKSHLELMPGKHFYHSPCKALQTWLFYAATREEIVFDPNSSGG
jgi:hypothetical protein